MTPGEREVAAEPLMRRQPAPPLVGIFLDLHTVFVNVGEPVPLDGDRTSTICGATVTIGPVAVDGPAGVVPYVQDCAYCAAILDGDTTPALFTAGWSLCLRRIDPDGSPGPVHIIGAEGVDDTTLTTRCGNRIMLDDTTEQVDPGHGVPCTPCLLRSTPN
ncbi:hypothetical protein [Actinoalloteichus sp. GBA129-24]|uniref:hypothetical protein n=1 Tax=Actinoalloteichus sp. GBA129-24 TaxID=1612551 RepID=UPI0009509FFF|nr:hypothetical protein [Actinoalloteichus sp. GBA129-24]APU23544.1 hypothetical protein UA75_27865 [Actinoalloteichus sp. GBA129-24]